MGFAVLERQAYQAEKLYGDPSAKKITALEYGRKIQSNVVRVSFISLQSPW
jgi:hypothetical protein